MRASTGIATFAVLGAALATAIAPRAALAAPNDEQVAQSLFDAARALMDKGDYARACPMLAESQRLDPGGGTLLNLAICHEGEGRTATAYLELQESLSQAVKDGRADREGIARQRIAALDPKLARIVVRVPGPRPEGLALEIDGAPTTLAILDVPTPYDPGEHHVQVSAPGYATLRWDGAATPGATVEAVIAMRAGGGASGAGAAGGAAAGAGAAGAPRHAAPSSHGLGLRGALAIGSGTLGVASIVTFALSFAARSAALDACIPERTFCDDDDGVAAVSRARTFAWVSIGTLAGAAVLGVAALFVKPPSRGGRSDWGSIAAGRF
jgi:hypothetical protein